jgi:hypothetical protein
VTDRDQNYDTKNDAPVAGATLYPAEQYSSCSAPFIGLSNDWTKLNAKINAMTPVGNTNQAIGLQVGWQTLTAAPFTVPPVDADYKYQTGRPKHRKSLVYKSIFDRHAPTEDLLQHQGGQDRPVTVQVNTGSDATSTILQNCASDGSTFFLLTTTGQMIGTSLSKLRLAM